MPITDQNLGQRCNVIYLTVRREQGQASTSNKIKRSAFIDITEFCLSVYVMCAQCANDCVCSVNVYICW